MQIHLRCLNVAVSEDKPEGLQIFAETKVIESLDGSQRSVNLTAAQSVAVPFGLLLKMYSITFKIKQV